jgi:hypothetical protein
MVALQWVGAIVAVLGLLYNGYKDYQHGDIKIPKIQLIRKQHLQKPQYPVQYCLMAYDPNIDKVFYLHENGQWHDYAPQQRRYAETPQNQNQGQAIVGVAHGTQGRSQGYTYGQQAQTPANP